MCMYVDLYVNVCIYLYVDLNVYVCIYVYLHVRWDAVKLVLPGGWLHLSDSGAIRVVAPGRMFGNFLPVPDAESLPLCLSALKLVVCEKTLYGAGLYMVGSSEDKSYPA